MAERSHLSIGEVLSLLREEFPDVTISKIRFLESQGLVDPERTPSGYRKFYDHDVERLRWILRQQREHFLPLKVIRGRLTEQGVGEGVEDGSDLSGLATESPPDGGDPAAAHVAASEVATGHDAAPQVAAGREAPAPRSKTHESRHEEPGYASAAREQAEPAAAHAGMVRAAGREGPGRPVPPTPSLFADLHRDAPTPTDKSAGGRPAPSEEADTYTAEELAAAAGTETELVQELKQYGLIVAQAVVAGVAYYDATALAVTRAASQFSRHGVEARHLRPWRNAADREADLFQQVVLPLLRQRNPHARHQALETLSELASAGAALRSALVERAIRDIR